MTRDMVPEVLRMMGSIVAALLYFYLVRSGPDWLHLPVLMGLGGVFQQAAESLYRKRQVWLRS